MPKADDKVITLQTEMAVSQPSSPCKIRRQGSMSTLRFGASVCVRVLILITVLPL
jgi:hypothetical protein